MKTGRDDLDAMVRVTSIPADEPTFLLRAQDSCAAEAVRAWAEFSLAAGAPIAVVEQALKQADAMEAWPIKKTAGADHLTGDEAMRLKYEFGRRTWSIGHRDPAFLAAARVLEGRLTKLQPLVDFLTGLADSPDQAVEVAGPDIMSLVRYGARLALKKAGLRQ